MYFNLIIFNNSFFLLFSIYEKYIQIYIHFRNAHIKTLQHKITYPCRQRFCDDPNSTFERERCLTSPLPQTQRLLIICTEYLSRTGPRFLSYHCLNIAVQLADFIAHNKINIHVRRLHSSRKTAETEECIYTEICA